MGFVIPRYLPISMSFPTNGTSERTSHGIRLRGFYRTVQIRADSHTAPHARDSAPKRKRTLPKQYSLQVYERQSLPEVRRMLLFGRSPVRKTLQDNGFECDIETHSIMIVCNICGGTLLRCRRYRFLPKFYKRIISSIRRFNYFCTPFNKP